MACIVHMRIAGFTLGLSAAGRLLVVNHTFPQRITDRVPVRIISSRKATTREKRQYQET
jgi:uncharacterized DUF497 family protein